MAWTSYLVSWPDPLCEDSHSLISYCITIMSATILYFLLARENKRRAAMELNDVDRDKMAFQDLTDKENPYFTYVL
jgi:hypothetical protein